MDISRRAVLLAAAAAPIGVVTACGGDDSGPPPPEDLDQQARESAAQSELELIAAYRAAAASNPGRAVELEFLAGQHEQHLPALYPNGDGPVPASPVGQAPGLSALRKLEQAAAKQRTSAAVSAADVALIATLARIAASESGHAAYLARTGA